MRFYSRGEWRAGRHPEKGYRRILADRGWTSWERPNGLVQMLLRAREARYDRICRSSPGRWRGSASGKTPRRIEGPLD
jgi:hypothetical protein